MDVVWTILPLLVFAFALDGAFRRGADDPSWELHWRLLDTAGRARIVTAAHSRDARAALTDPEDLRLVTGYERRRRRRGANVELAVSSFLIVGAAFVVVGVLDASDYGFIFSVAFLLISLWTYLRDRHLDGTTRTVDPDTVL